MASMKAIKIMIIDKMTTRGLKMSPSGLTQRIKMDFKARLNSMASSKFLKSTKKIHSLINK